MSLILATVDSRQKFLLSSSFTVVLPLVLTEEAAALSELLVDLPALDGEVITIDGGEWISKAGQFNMLNKVPNKLWALISKATRKKK